MAIERIHKIKNHRIFREFSWPSDLPDFNARNLIYGWNGTGKSTLSNLFRSMESRTPITEGEVDFVISGTRINGAKFAESPWLPEVRVFNREFVSDNVFTDTGSASPIFILGQKSIEKQKEVERLEVDFRRISDDIKEHQERIDRARKDLDKFKIDGAKAIKDLLSSSGTGNSYNTYHKTNYQSKCDQYLKMSDTEREAKILSDTDFKMKKRTAVANRMGEISILTFSYPDTQNLTERVAELLRKTVTSSVIDILRSDHELATWVRTGLERHKERQSTDCLFCGQPLPDDRVRELEAHFNDEFKTLAVEIESQCAAIKSAMKSLNSWNPPHRSEFYQDLVSEFDSRRQELSHEIARIKDYLGRLLGALESKSQNPFLALDLSHDVVIGNADIISGVNAVISKHNEKSSQFHAMIESARSAIEESLIAQDLARYQEKHDKVNDADVPLREASSKSAVLTERILKIQSEIVEHRRPADELNADIRSYLGRDELTFEIRENGYQISRYGAPANDLSEGEKTAIAFLYFLKSLEDKSFSLEDGVVVIDDPVSSLDSNALFHAFGFLKEKTKRAGQLFVLTHNHSFFRQVRNWFNGLANRQDGNVDQNPSRFYMLVSRVIEQSRSSSISELDKLLHKYESEYHYLFSLVYKAAYSDEETDLEQNYVLPNVARRLLESFLAFRYPAKSGGLSQKVGDISGFDVATKTSVLKFVHAHSHADEIGEPEHDSSILIESKQVLIGLLSLIESEDERHYRQMEKLARV